MYLTWACLVRNVLVFVLFADEVKTYTSAPPRIATAPEDVEELPAANCSPPKKKGLFSKLKTNKRTKQTTTFADEIRLFEAAFPAHDGMLAM